MKTFNYNVPSKTHNMSLCYGTKSFSANINNAQHTILASMESILTMQRLAGVNSMIIDNSEQMVVYFMYNAAATDDFILDNANANTFAYGELNSNNTIVLESQSSTATMSTYTSGEDVMVVDNSDINLYVMTPIVGSSTMVIGEDTMSASIGVSMTGDNGLVLINDGDASSIGYVDVHEDILIDSDAGIKLTQYIYPGTNTIVLTEGVASVSLNRLRLLSDMISDTLTDFSTMTMEDVYYIEY